MNILDLIFPKRCLGCGKIGRYFCEKCRIGIRPVLDNERICPMCGRLAFGGITHPSCRSKYDIDGLVSFFHYDGIIRKAIKAVKYRSIFDIADEFVSLIPRAHISTGVFVPIPLHISRYRMRGFNQAEVLGKYIAEQWDMPIHTNILVRIKKTTPQAELKHRKERLENMDNVFGVKSIETPPNLILFDDVFTTGATMRSAAKVLKQKGASSLWAMTMAR